MSILIGNGPFYQLYFLPLLFQMFLLLPIVERISTKKGISVLIGATIILYSAYEFVCLFGILPQPIVTNIYSYCLVPFFPAWCVYFVGGYTVSKHYDSVRNYILSRPMWQFVLFAICAFALTFFDMLICARITGKYLGLLNTVFKPSVALFSFASILLLLKIGMEYTIPVFLQKLYKASFGIYLSHVGVIMVLNFITAGIIFSNIILSSIAVVLTILISYLIDFCIKKTPLKPLFLGSH